MSRFDTMNLNTPHTDREMDMLPQGAAGDIGKPMSGGVISRETAIGVERSGWNAAIAWVEKHLADYIAEHGIHDPETGATEFPDGGEYESSIVDIIDGMRLAMPATLSRPAQDTVQAALAAQGEPDWTETARHMLEVWDSWLGGKAPARRDDADRLLLAACFAAQQFEDLASSGVTADGAPGGLLRAFLLALIDPSLSDLDHLRACNRKPDAPASAGVTVKPLVWKPILGTNERAYAVGLCYEIACRGSSGEWFWWRHGMAHRKSAPFPSVNAAKAAAQADFAARILRALSQPAQGGEGGEG